VIFGVCLLLPTVAAAYCPGSDSTRPAYDPDYYSVPKELARARYVLIGKVVREIWLGEDGKPKRLEPPFQFGEPRPWGFDPYAGAVYEVEIARAFKGHPASRIRLFSENSTARFWLDIGSTYLLFVTEEKFDAPIGTRLTIDTCGNSGLVEKSTATLNILVKTKNVHVPRAREE